MSRKIFLVCLLLGLLVSPLLSCAKPTPPPAPKPTPAPAPAPAPKPAAPTPAPGPAPPRQVAINLIGAPPGGTNYFLSFGLADLINKYHPWLRVSFTAGGGSTANTRILAEQAEKRKDTVIHTCGTPYVLAQLGQKPFTAPYTSLKVIAYQSLNVGFLCTLNKNIKTMNDLAGKKISPGLATHDQWEPFNAYLTYGLAIKDKVQVSAMDFAQIKDSLVAGTIDAGYMCGYKTPQEWVPFPQLSELLLAGKQLYFLGFDENAMKLTREKSGFTTFVPAKVPAGAFGPNMPPSEITGFPMTCNWYADSAMDGEIVYEITKLVYDHIGDFKNYHAAGKAMGHGVMANIPGYAEADFHSGAVKFYKEKGIKIGG